MFRRHGILLLAVALVTLAGLTARLRPVLARAPLDPPQGKVAKAKEEAARQEKQSRRREQTLPFVECTNHFDVTLRLVLEATKDPDEAVRVDAVAMLGKFDIRSFGQELPTDVLAALTKALSDPKEAVRIQAVGTCRQYHEAIPALINALQDRNPIVRQKAAAAIAHARSNAKEAIPALRAALKDPDPAVRLDMAEALWKVSDQEDEAAPILAEALKDKGLRYRAASILSEMGSDARAAAPLLKEALRDAQSNERVLVAMALWKTTEETKEVVPILIAILAEDDEEARDRAIGVLGEMGPKAGNAVPILVKIFRGRDLLARLQAAQALLRIDPTAAKEAGVK